MKYSVVTVVYSHLLESDCLGRKMRRNSCYSGYENLKAVSWSLSVEHDDIINQTQDYRIIKLPELEETFKNIKSNCQTSITSVTPVALNYHPVPDPDAF